MLVVLVLVIQYMSTYFGERWNHKLHMDIFAGHWRVTKSCIASRCETKLMIKVIICNSNDFSTSYHSYFDVGAILII